MSNTGTKISVTSTIKLLKLISPSQKKQLEKIFQKNRFSEKDFISSVKEDFKLGDKMEDVLISALYKYYKYKQTYKNSEYLHLTKEEFIKAVSDEGKPLTKSQKILIGLIFEYFETKEKIKNIKIVKKIISHKKKKESEKKSEKDSDEKNLITILNIINANIRGYIEGYKLYQDIFNMCRIYIDYFEEKKLSETKTTIRRIFKNLKTIEKRKYENIDEKIKDVAKIFKVPKVKNSKSTLNSNKIKSIFIEIEKTVNSCIKSTDNQSKTTGDYDKEVEELVNAIDNFRGVMSRNLLTGINVEENWDVDLDYANKAIHLDGVELRPGYKEFKQFDPHPLTLENAFKECFDKILKNQSYEAVLKWKESTEEQLEKMDTTNSNFLKKINSYVEGNMLLVLFTHFFRDHLKSAIENFEKIFDPKNIEKPKISKKKCPLFDERVTKSLISLVGDLDTEKYKIPPQYLKMRVPKEFNRKKY